MVGDASRSRFEGDANFVLHLRPIGARTIILMVVLLAVGLSLAAKDKKKASNVFDADPDQVFNAIYRYAQHNGTIKWSDEKRFTLSGVIFVPGGLWDWQKHFDCTISVEPVEGGSKSAVDVVGISPAKQQSLLGSFGEGPAVKVLRGIRAEFDRMAQNRTVGFLA